MKIEKNTSILWNDLWNGSGAEPATLETFLKERKSIRWQRIRRILADTYGNIEGMTAVELGSGMGTYGALLASEGVKITLVDYAPNGLKLAKSFFNKLKLKANFVCADILNLDKHFNNKFDLTTSCGVIEHFKGDERASVLDVHWRLLKPGGMTLIMVPNAQNLPYRFYKKFAEFGGFWSWGEEYPYTRKELMLWLAKKRCDDYGWFADSYLWSLNFMNPFVLLGRRWVWFKRGTIPQTVGTPFDTYAFSLGCWAIKEV